MRLAGAGRFPILNAGRDARIRRKSLQFDETSSGVLLLVDYVALTMIPEWKLFVKSSELVTHSVLGFWIELAEGFIHL